MARENLANSENQSLIARICALERELEAARNLRQSYMNEREEGEERVR